MASSHTHSLLIDTLVCFVANCPKEHLTLGVNTTTKSIKSLKLVIVFVDAGQIVTHLPPLVFSAGVDCCAIAQVPTELLKSLKVKKLACLGVKQAAQEISDFPQLVLQVQKCPAIDDVPFGNLELAQRAIAQTPVAVKKRPAAAAAAAAPKATPKALPQKRFFSSLD